MNKEKKTIRCAIYTRKSVSEGLDMDFNSLDAQREAGLNYIASQKAEGWIPIDKHYDDGGYTGGNMERPALSELLSDIKKGLVDMVVVYKVDRLSRSLMDFAKIVELFESHKVSFVSVTQHFNTKDSMGRLTLNILLSFAQFEREIISERTRDKITAARKKGKWVGGIPILGYDIVYGGKGIKINEIEAKRVREIFQFYNDCGSLGQTVEYLRSQNIRTKEWMSVKGNKKGGREFSKSTVNRLLKNYAYIGKINVNGEFYTAEFNGVVPEDLFNSVQNRLKGNCIDKGARQRNRYKALLVGKLFCGNCGKLMGHTYTKKSSGKIYRYYVCNEASQKGWNQCPYPSVPADEIEKFTIDELSHITDNESLLSEVIENFNQKNREMLLENSKFIESVKLSLGAIRANIKKTDDITRQRFFISQEEVALASLQRAECERSEICSRIEMNSEELKNLLKNFREIWENITYNERIELIDLLIEKITLNAESGDIFITYKNSNTIWKL